MKHWTVSYLLHVLDAKEWSMNRLATESGVAASTINRPIREENWEYGLSAKTVSKIHRASGIDPTPFMPDGMHEPAAMFLGRQPKKGPETTTGHVSADLDTASDQALRINDINISVTGSVAQIVALVDRDGIPELRAKLDALETLLPNRVQQKNDKQEK